MRNKNLNIVQQIYQAMREGDTSAMFRNVSPDIEIVQSSVMPWGGSYQGSGHAMQFFAKVTSHLAASVEIDSFLDSGDHILAIGRTTGTVKSTGAHFDTPLVHIWKIKGDQIAGLHVYLDEACMLAALSPATEAGQAEARSL